MKKLIAVLTLVISGISFPQQGWVWQNPLPQGNSLNAIQSINSTSGFACGRNGTILKTDSSGSGWELLNFPARANITSLDFITENDGWAAGIADSTAYVYNTSDGGNSWQSSMEKKAGQVSLFFLNENRGWISIDSTLFTVINSAAPSSIKSFPQIIYSIFFLNTNTGWLAAGNYVYKTTDGGINWQKISVGTPYIFFNLTKIRFVNDSTGYVSGTEVGPNDYSGYLYKSTDGGKTWNEQLQVGVPLINYRTINDFELYNGNLGWAVSGGEVFKTYDGKNWTQISNVPYLTCITAAGSSTLWGAGGFGALYISTDGGYNWVKSYSGYITETNDIQSLNNKDIFVAGGRTILKSVDGGNKWDTINVAASDSNYFDIRTVIFTDTLKGWIGVDESRGWGAIYRTTDGGLSWSDQLDSVQTIYDIFFIDKKTGWFFSGSNSYRTDDSGKTWNLQTGNRTNAQINSIFFTSPDTGYAGGYLGLYKTSDGGNNWSKINLNMPDPYIHGIYFINSQLGWACGYTGNNGYVVKTTDGGSSWNVYNLPQVSYTVWPQSIYFINTNDGWVVGNTGSGGIAFKTSDGGIDWTSISLPSNAGFEKIVFSDDLNGWILGNNGIVLHTSNGGITFIKNSNISRPAEFMLYQNYPNPFNPTTTIYYQLPDAGYVTLKVYDVLGNLVKTLVRGYKQQGKYSVSFNAGSFASGVYFYRIAIHSDRLSETSSRGYDFVSVKKMLLLK